MEGLTYFHFDCPAGENPMDFLREFAADDPAELRVEGTGRTARIVKDGSGWFRVEVIRQPWGIAAHLSGDSEGFSERMLTALTRRYGQVAVEER